MIIVGVLLAVLAAALGTTSKQLIAASEHLGKRWLFHLGAGMNIGVGPVVDASAYAFAPQVIIAPFACLDVIFNAITAPYTLRWQQERLTRTHFHGTALVFVGAVFTSVFAQADNIIYNVYELEAQLFWRPTSLVYMAVEVAAIISVSVALRKKLLSPNVRGISLGVVAGALMGNIFFMKGIIGIIQSMVSSGSAEAMRRPTPYILGIGAGGGAILGHLFLRQGLGEYKGVFMVTIFEGAHICCGCLSGCVVMEEMAGAPWWRYLMYWFSVLLIISGMLLINKHSAESQMEKKFHIAQSFAEPPSNNEEEKDSLYPPMRLSTDSMDSIASSQQQLNTKLGRPLEDLEMDEADEVPELEGDDFGKGPSHGGSSKVAVADGEAAVSTDVSIRDRRSARDYAPSELA